jgi:hypothetical protein
MCRRPQRYATNTVRQDVASMTVYHTVHIRKPLIDLGMDMSLHISWLDIFLLNLLRRVHLVLY